jgi:hypothetical protein
VHCMAHVLNLWTGRYQSSQAWSDELTRELRRKAPAEKGRSVGDVIGSAYNITFGVGMKIDIEAAEARAVLAVMACLEAAVVNVLQDYSFTSPDEDDDAIKFHYAERNWGRRTTVDQRNLERDKHRVRNMQRAFTHVNACFSRIHPLKSLKGLRATATGSYAVTVRLAPGHIDPIILSSVAGAVFRKGDPSEFWGNNKCAAYPGMGLQVTQKFPVCNPIRDIIPRVEYVPHGHSRTPPPQAPEIGMQVPMSNGFVKVYWCDSPRPHILGRPIRCVYLKAHRNKIGFRGPDKCRICGGYGKLATVGHTVQVLVSQLGETTDRIELNATRLVFPPGMAASTNAGAANGLNFVETNLKRQVIVQACNMVHLGRKRVLPIYYAPPRDPDDRDLHANVLRVRANMNCETRSLSGSWLQMEALRQELLPDEVSTLTWQSGMDRHGRVHSRPGSRTTQYS